MAEKPILFNAEMVQSVLSGSKTQTRRVCKDFIYYSLTDDRIYGILTDVNGGCYEKEANFKGNTDISEQQLPSWVGRTDLFTDEIQGLWEEGVRGLVSIKRRNSKRLQVDIDVAQGEEGHENNPQARLHGVSWFAVKEILSGKTFGWKPAEQPPTKSLLGDTARKLDGQKDSWERERGGKTSDVKNEQQRLRSFEVGNVGWAVQPSSGGKSSWNFSEWSISHCKFQKELILWVRETFAIECNDGLQDIYNEPDDPLGPVRKVDEGETHIGAEYFECPRYRASEPETILGDDGLMRWKPSIFMPRWASRIQLEITNIRVERIRDITRQDAIAEGIKLEPDINSGIDYSVGGRFQYLWDSINKKRGLGWETNPWVWVVEFKRVN